MQVAKIHDAVLEYEEEDVARLVQAEVDAGTDIKVILEEGLIKPLDVVGEQFSDGTLFVPEMLMAAEAVAAGLGIVRPLLVETGAKPAGTIVLGTVKGDLHDIGKNLVRMMLEGAGFNVKDLGVDVSPEDFITAIEETNADMVCMSALLTTTMDNMGSIIQAIVEAELRSEVRILIGGAPVSAGYAEKIGADGYAEDAAGAVEEAHRLINA